MKSLGAGVLACILALTLVSCSGANVSADKLQAVQEKYQQLADSYTGNQTLMIQVGQQKPDLVNSYNELGVKIVELGNQITPNLNQMSESEVDALIAQIDQVNDGLEKLLPQIQALSGTPAKSESPAKKE